MLLLLALAPLSITAPYVLLEPEQPDGTITFPASLKSNRRGTCWWCWMAWEKTSCGTLP